MALVSTAASRGIVFAPPLIGGDVAQQIRYLRSLINSGFDLVSFTYSGHGRSSGSFCLSTALADTYAAATFLRRRLAHTSMPVFGVGCCFAAIPLLEVVAKLNGLCQGIVLLNAITHFGIYRWLRSFFVFYGKLIQQEGRPPALQTAATRFLGRFFPHIAITPDAFGQLAFERTRWQRMAKELMGFDPLKSTWLAGMPTLCLYGRNDRLLRTLIQPSEEAYRRQIRRICPDAAFVPLCGDHYFSHPAMRSKALAAVLAFTTTA
jgi:pimeloyl-ACP methyl ester carboxylesterase